MIEKSKRLAPKIFITGLGGQLGLAFKDLLGEHAVLLGRGQLNLESPKEVRDKILELQPDILINAAAYTKVDQAEREEELAYKINAESPFEMAKACHEVGASFVSYSTDYVYSGTGDTAWKETDPVSPQNAYGRGKAHGERLILDWAPPSFRFLIFRTSWVYSHIGKNFVLTMLKLGAERDELKIVCDQIGSPTYAPDLAKYSFEAIKTLHAASAGASQNLRGVYNCCAQGETSWFDFAKAIFLKAEQDNFGLRIRHVLPIKSAEYPTPAIRPLNSKMCQEKLELSFGIRLPHWKVALDQCFWQIERLKGVQS